MILGDFRILYIKISDTYVPIGCLTGNSFSETAQQLPTTTRDNAGWSTFRPTGQSYNISFSGIQDPDQTLGYTELKELKRNQTRVDWKLEATDAGLADFGVGYITDLSETADVGEFMTFEGTLQGYGKPVELSDNVAPTAPTLLPVEYDILFGTQLIGVILTWEGATDDIGIRGYEVRIVANNTTTSIVDVGNVLTYTDRSIIQGAPWEYNVRAYDLAGNVSPWSNKRFVFFPVASAPEDQVTAILYQSGASQITQAGVATIFQ